MRPIPRRLLPDDMMVRPSNGDGSFGDARLIRHVWFQGSQSASSDDHRSADAGTGKVFVDAVNSEGAFEVPAGSRVTLSGMTTSLSVISCKRCCVIRGEVHHWELTVR